MYDQSTKYRVPNEINRYALGSMSNVNKNNDGSITLYLQADNPGPEKESTGCRHPKGRFTSSCGTTHRSLK
jgi:hypothetical protein